ncbi:MAG: hypothetical protein FRX49_08747 [Trebouxia sp. A1-2]|nr:MAG: hypothetical protein FRX49_08747 [Trebouxia sp. A1-2]
MVLVSVKTKEHTAASPPGELDTQKSYAAHLQQPHYHNGIVMGAAQMLTQGFDNCTNRDSAPVKRHGLPNGFQTSSYEARKVPATISNRKSIIKTVKYDCVEM